MKRYLLGVGTMVLLLSACSKESKCIKGELIGYNPCTKAWGIQIIEGPRIGTPYGNKENVIELYNAPTDKSPGTIVYFTYKKKESTTDEKVCITVLPNIDYSTVERSLVAWSETECN